MIPPVHDTGWFKCSRSGSSSDACVEVRIAEAAVGIRDSKNQAGPSFAIPNGAWDRFVTAIKDGQIG